MPEADLQRSFIYAVAYCLRAERSAGLAPLTAWFESGRSRSEAPGDAQPDLAAAAWALGEGDAAAAPAGAVALVAGGATRIKGYVFESAHLPEIRGASALLDRINIQDVRALWQGERGCPECVIYANGGEVLAFAPARFAAELADEIERIYTRETLTAQSTVATRTYTLAQLRAGRPGPDVTAEQARAAAALLGAPAGEQGSFGALVAPLALDRFRRREGNPDPARSPATRVPAHFETVPFARRCDSCDERPAVCAAERPAGEGEHSLCEPCARKRVYGVRAKHESGAPGWWNRARFTWQPAQETRSWADQFVEWLSDPSRAGLAAGYGSPEALERARTAPDLNAVGAASTPQGYIGLIYADGNNMGALIEGLRSPSDYSTFASSVYDAVLNGVFGALAEQLELPKGLQPVHPFEILGIGGDDVLVVVPASAALPVARDLCKRVERELAGQEMFHLAGPAARGQAHRCAVHDGQADGPQSSVSVSAGVVLADAHTPVYYLQELAGQLLKSAKRRAKDLKRDHGFYGGTVDFMALKSVSVPAGTVEEFRQKALRRPGRNLYARPYTFPEMEALEESVRALKQARFPRSQLYRLREALGKGQARSSVDYLYFLSRSRSTREARQQVEALWPARGEAQPPWMAVGGSAPLETVWYDLADLYDFVPGPPGVDENAGD